jgi:type I restriction enzyme S subunit
VSDELPEGWTETTLGQVAESISYGYTAKSASRTKGPRYLRITDIQNNSVDWTSVPSCAIPAERVPAYELRSGDLVFARTGATTGKSFLIKSCPEAVFASYLIRVRPATSLVPEFIARFFQSSAYWSQVAENISGSAQPNCNASKLSSLIVPIPPLPEQQRIVAKLEKLLGQVDVCQHRLAKIPALLKRFRQAVLAAACSGRLTADWREKNPDAIPYTATIEDGVEPDEELLTNWIAVRLGVLTELVTSGSRGWAKYYAESGSIFIRAQNINSDFLNLDDIAFVRPPVSAEGLRTKVKQHDLLITITGANVTKSALVEKPIKDAYVSQHVALVRLKDVRISEFLFHSVVSLAHGRKQLQAAAYGQGKPGLNLDNIRDVVIGLPPLPEQEEIIRRVKNLFTLAERIESRFAEGRKRVDSMTQAILAKAFRGELVPTEFELAKAEGRSFESAEELLNRVGRNGHNQKKTQKVKPKLHGSKSI